MDNQLFLSKDAAVIVTDIIVLIAAENIGKSKSWEIKVDEEVIGLVNEISQNMYAINRSFHKKISILPIHQIKNIILYSNMSKQCKREVLLYISHQEDIINTNKRMDHLEEKINQINDHLKLLVDALDLYKKN